MKCSFRETYVDCEIKINRPGAKLLPCDSSIYINRNSITITFTDSSMILLVRELKIPQKAHFIL